MRKLIVSIVSIAALLGCFSAVQAQAGTQSIDIQNQYGSLTGTLTIEAGTLTLDAAASVVATGKTYTIDADATLSGTPGNYTVSGTAVISDGTTTKTITFNCPGTTTVTAATSFVGKVVTYTLSQRPPPVKKSWSSRVTSGSNVQ